MADQAEEALRSAAATALPANRQVDAAAALAARGWLRKLAAYRDPDHGRSFVELAITVAPLFLLWGAMWVALSWSYWLSLLLALPTAGFLVRLFMIQHDCGHGAFFRTRRLNDWVGRGIGVLTLTPYGFWRRSHNMHHAGSGNLARRGIGDIVTLTVREYVALPWWRRLRYRLYRHPAVMFGIGPAFLFLVQQRLPIGAMRDKTEWSSTMTTNAAIAVVVAGFVWVIGLVPFLLLQLPVILLAAAIGVWLFYVQHQFEATFWAQDVDWSQPEAALHGSSHYDLPRVLRWFTANIGIHHVHHLSSRIPYYRLPGVLRDHPQLADIGRLSLGESIRCVRLVLWDEVRRKLISFRDARALSAAAIAG